MRGRQSTLRCASVRRFGLHCQAGVALPSSTVSKPGYSWATTEVAHSRLRNTLADEGAGVLLATCFGGGALQTGATWFDELIRRTETPCRALRSARVRKRKSSACFEIVLLNADRRLACRAERRAGLRRADPAALTTSAAIRSTCSTLAHTATREAAARDSRPLTAEARIACPTDIRRCVVRTDDFAFRAGRPAGSVATLASLAAGLVHRLT